VPVAPVPAPLPVFAGATHLTPRVYGPNGSVAMARLRKAASTGNNALSFAVFGRGVRSVVRYPEQAAFGNSVKAGMFELALS